MKLPNLLYSVIIIACCACTNKKTDESIAAVKDTIAIAPPVKDTIVVKDSTITKERFYDNLSYTHNYKLTYYEHYKGKDDPDTHYWTIAVYNKKMKLVDSIIQPVNVYFAGFIDFSSVRSYATGTNLNEIRDNYAGDFIVADFNFDNKNDFAIINDMGGNGGTFYSYYLQQEKNKYIEDRFLSDSVTYFPEINKNKRTLTTYVHAWSCGESEDIFKQDGRTWKRASHRTIDYCNGGKR